MNEIETLASKISQLAEQVQINITPDEILALVQQGMRHSKKRDVAVLLKHFPKLLGTKYLDMNGERLYLIIRNGQATTLLLRRKDEDCSARAFRVENIQKV